VSKCKFVTLNGTHDECRTHGFTVHATERCPGRTVTDDVVSTNASPEPSAVKAVKARLRAHADQVFRDGGLSREDRIRREAADAALERAAPMVFSMLVQKGIAPGFAFDVADAIRALKGGGK
jgi:hypothetical protein